MATSGTCPRGHELAENAVYCTVCWIRVEPVDPEVVAARKRRQRRIWIPLFGAGAVAFGVVVGGSLGSGSGTGSAIVAADAPAQSTPVEATGAAPSRPAPSAAPTASAASEAAGPETVVAPLAATVAEPLVRTLTACVPAETAAIVLKGRSSTDDPWVEQEAEVAIGAQGGCAEGEVEAAISSGTDATRWRLVLLDGDGERIGKDTVDAPTG